jgi:hypothetical protein
MIEDTIISYIVRPEYHEKQSKRNPWNIIVMPRRNEWPMRSLVAKGVNFPTTFWRPMNQWELDFYSGHWRCSFIRYMTWEGLIEDEISVLGKEHSFICDLREYAQKFDFIPYFKVGKQLEIFNNSNT